MRTFLRILTAVIGLLGAVIVLVTAWIQLTKETLVTPTPVIVILTAIAPQPTIQSTATPEQVTQSPTAPVTISVVSAIGDLVSTNSSGPFNLAATEAYLGVGGPSVWDTRGWANIPGATRIWYMDYRAGPLYFAKTIELSSQATQINGALQITADNYFNLWLNDVDYGGTAPPDTGQHNHIYTYNLTNLTAGTNRLMIKVSEDAPGTPAMLVYKLTITYLLP